MSEIQGLTYTIRYAADIGQGAPSGPIHSEWTASALVSNGRGRISILHGTVGQTFGEGDYALFDAARTVIVFPKDGTFLTQPDFGRAKMQGRRLGMTAEDLKWTIDTLGPAAEIGGIPTRRFRVTLTCRMRFTARLEPSDFIEEIPMPVLTHTSDYWRARVDGLPPNPGAPFVPAGRSGVPGMETLASTWASIESTLAETGVALRSKSTIRVVTGPIENVTTSEVSIADLRPTSFDAALLELPAGLREKVKADA